MNPRHTDQGGVWKWPSWTFFCHRLGIRLGIRFGIWVCAGLFPALSYAHGVSGSDGAFLDNNSGLALGPYLYLGAKHMVTGYDHLLFLAGVVFFLHRLKDVALYVTLFALGHSVTLLLGVLAGWRLNVYLVDAIIGFSVVYKAYENMGGLRRIEWLPNLKWAVLLFGLCHGFGLATKLQDLSLADEGLVPNMLAFNIGVEIGQLLALAGIVLLLNQWRKHPSFSKQAWAANWVIMVAGFMLMGLHLVGYLNPNIALT